MDGWKLVTICLNDDHATIVTEAVVMKSTVKTWPQGMPNYPTYRPYNTDAAATSNVSQGDLMMTQTDSAITR